MLPLSMEKSTQSRTAITPFSAFLMGDRPPLRMEGGVQRPSFFLCRPFRGSLRRKASLRSERFQPSKVLPKPHLACFQPSGVLPRLPRRIFNPQKCSRSLARRVFNLREYSRGFRRSAAHCLPSFLRKLARYFCRKALPCDKSTFNSIQTKIIIN